MWRKWNKILLLLRLVLRSSFPPLRQTSTGLHAARGEILVVHFCIVAALALAEPTAVAMGVARDESDDDQAAEGFVDEEFW